MLLFAMRAGDTIPRHELIGDDVDVGERTIDVQINRLRRKIEDDPGKPGLAADGSRHRLPAEHRLTVAASPGRTANAEMVTFETFDARNRLARQLARRCSGSAGCAAYLPTGLYTRSLLIIIIPMVLLQSVVAAVFMERHWQMVTRAPVDGRHARHRRHHPDLIETYPQDSAIIAEIIAHRPRPDEPQHLDRERTAICRRRGPSRFSPILDGILSDEISDQIKLPVLDRHARRFYLVEIRIKLDRQDPSRA